MRYRIKIEQIDGKPKWKHIKNICFDTDNVEATIQSILHTVESEHLNALERFKSHLNAHHPTIYEQMVDELGDKFDINAIGSDTTPTEFMENEAFFD